MPNFDFVRPEAPAPAPKRPFAYSGCNTPKGLVRCLSALGFPINGKIQALAASNQSIGGAGLKIAVHELDAVLAGYDISTRQRLTLKLEMQKQGILV